VQLETEQRRSEAVRSRPTGDDRSEAMRASASAVAAIVFAVVIFYAVAASAGPS